MERSEETRDDRKIGQELAKNLPTEKPNSNSRRHFPRTHAGYWKSRLERRSYTYQGALQEVPGWSVRMYYLGIRRSFDLGTVIKEEAASKARDIYLSLVAKGWDTTLTEFGLPAPQPQVARRGEPTVGMFLEEVDRTTSMKARTLRRNGQYFRMVVAHVLGIEEDKSKYDYKGGRRAEWLARIDAAPLRLITPAAAANWKVAYLARGKDDPQHRLQVNRSFNAALRHCKSLFRSEVVEQPNFGVKVPRFPITLAQSGAREIYWFEQLKFEKYGSMKFRAPDGVSVEKLVTAARSELRKSFPESYKLLLLCLCAGLRRSEADLLLWSQLRADDNSITIEMTKYLQPKHDSGGTVYVDSLLMQELMSFKPEAKGEFLVESDRGFVRAVDYRYRCAPHWRTLMRWLGTQGITVAKKIHELRKLFGDSIVKRSGIFAGSAQLRHSSIQMTASHYADPRQRAVIPMGKLLSE
jgi:integrase